MVFICCSSRFFMQVLLRTPPWQRLEYTCANEIPITQILAAPGQITLLFNDGFYPMKQGEDGNLFEEAEEVQHAEKCKLVASTVKTLTGTVTYLPRVALPENAVVQVQLQDVSMQDVAATVLAEHIIETNGQQVPIPFSLSYDETRLEPNRIYALSVRITVDDKLLWINTTQLRVLSDGYSSDKVEVRVEQVQ